MFTLYPPLFSSYQTYAIAVALCLMPVSGTKESSELSEISSNPGNVEASAARARRSASSFSLFCISNAFSASAAFSANSERSFCSSFKPGLPSLLSSGNPLKSEIFFAEGRSTASPGVADLAIGISFLISSYTSCLVLVTSFSFIEDNLFKALNISLSYISITALALLPVMGLLVDGSTNLAPPLIVGYTA